ncbi:MAG: hypothetical protein KGZ83_12055 [Sulfuricella sp.]|nr:hypothetical protein [Sulfuricella sp.]
MYKVFLYMGMTILGFATSGFALAVNDGAKIFEDACSECHHPKKKPLDDTHLSREKWQEAYDLMVEKDKLDAPLSKAQLEELLNWLVSTHGPASTPATGVPPDAGKN